MPSVCLCVCKTAERNIVTAGSQTIQRLPTALIFEQLTKRMTPSILLQIITTTNSTVVMHIY